MNDVQKLIKRFQLEPHIEGGFKPDGQLLRTLLGNPLEGEDVVPQYNIPAGVWFAAKVHALNSFSMTGCTVSPGFEYEDMETDKGGLLKKYPQHADIIQQFMR